MQKYLVIAIPPNLRTALGAIEDFERDIDAMVSDYSLASEGQFQRVPDADVAVLKGTDAHARAALMEYRLNAEMKGKPIAADWADEKLRGWTGPTHEPD